MQNATTTHTDVQAILPRAVTIQGVKAEGGQVVHLITSVVGIGGGGGGSIGNGAADGGGAGVATVATTVVTRGGVAGAAAGPCNATFNEY